MKGAGEAWAATATVALRCGHAISKRPKKLVAMTADLKDCLVIYSSRVDREEGVPMGRGMDLRASGLPTSPKAMVAKSEAEAIEWKISAPRGKRCPFG